MSQRCAARYSAVAASVYVAKKKAPIHVAINEINTETMVVKGHAMITMKNTCDGGKKTSERKTYATYFVVPAAPIKRKKRSTRWMYSPAAHSGNRLFSITVTLSGTGRLRPVSLSFSTCMMRLLATSITCTTQNSTLTDFASLTPSSTSSAFAFLQLRPIKLLGLE